MQNSSEFAYPADLARFACDRWPGPSPPLAVLKALYATCYHASQLREEDRSVQFRAILAEPDDLPPHGAPPRGLHRLEFASTRPFDARELRRLSAAADFDRSLIAVRADADGRLSIWGLIHQGPRWLQDVVGGRGSGPSLPPLPVVHVLAPGSIEARSGMEFIGSLEQGRLSGIRLDIFSTAWLPHEFDQLQRDLADAHAELRGGAEGAGRRWGSIEGSVPRLIGERVMKRVLALVRRQRHGGTVLFVSPDDAPTLTAPNPYLDIKYNFIEAKARRQFFKLMLHILNRLAAVYPERDTIAWRDFVSTQDEELTALDEALFEIAYLIAGLTAVDGAVVLDKHMEILGFGAEISGQLPDVPVIHRALDLEGDAVEEELATNEGTRHRSAYRLINHLPGSLAVVMSQDGAARFVASRHGRPTYWEHE
jgi:hypothetical protein